MSRACAERIVHAHGFGREAAFNTFVAVEIFFILRHPEEMSMDLFQNTAVDLAGWRNGTQAPKKADCSLQELPEAVRVDELAQPSVVICCRQDEHIAKLPRRISFFKSRKKFSGVWFTYA